MFAHESRNCWNAKREVDCVLLEFCRREKFYNLIYPCILTLISGIRMRYNLAIFVGQDRYNLSSLSHNAFRICVLGAYPKWIRIYCMDIFLRDISMTTPGFQRAIDMILFGVKWPNVLVYPDDLIVFSADAESHLSHLDTVLSQLGKHGVTLEAQKSHLFSSEVEYLGHVVRPGSLSVNQKNLKTIKKAVLLKTQAQLRRFLRMCNVYRRFTVDFAKTAKPLDDMNIVKLRMRFSPSTPEERAAFEKLREKLCHPHILAIRRKEGKYIIDVDASYEQLGCGIRQ